MLRLTRAQRLTSKFQFDAVYQNGRRFSNNCFTVLVRLNETGHARLGLSVAARMVGNAVNRNRIKRIVRESFRLHQDRLPALDVVVNARSAARDADKKLLADKLTRCWQDVIQRCATH